MNMRPRKHQLLGLLPDALVQTSGSRHGDTRYLTFDDGPDPSIHATIVGLAGQAGVKASFFLVGQKVERHPNWWNASWLRAICWAIIPYSHWSFKNMTTRKKLSEDRQHRRSCSAHSTGACNIEYGRHTDT